MPHPARGRGVRGADGASGARAGRPGLRTALTVTTRHLSLLAGDARHEDAIERAYAPGSELHDWFAAMLAADR